MSDEGIPPAAPYVKKLPAGAMPGYAAVSPEQKEKNLQKGRGTKTQIAPSQMLMNMRAVMRTTASDPAKPDTAEMASLRMLKHENLKEFVTQLRQMEQAHSAQKYAMKKARLESKMAGNEVNDGPIEDERSLVVMDRLKALIEKAVKG